MKTASTSAIILLSVLFISCGETPKREAAAATSMTTETTSINSDCVDFVQLLPAAEVAKEVGQSESWILANYKINVWENPSSQGFRGRSVGKIIPGSNCQLLEKRGNDYRVRSPFDNSVGWISSVQIKGVVKLNPRTFEPCP